MTEELSFNEKLSLGLPTASVQLKKLQKEALRKFVDMRILNDMRSGERQSSTYVDTVKFKHDFGVLGVEGLSTALTKLGYNVGITQTSQPDGTSHGILVVSW